jgi:hypothetical protein
MRPIQNSAKGRHRIRQRLPRMALVARPRGLRAWGLTLVLLLGSIAAVAGAVSGPASATTACTTGPGDFGKVYLSAAWPGGFTGVPVYSNDYADGSGAFVSKCENYATTPTGASVESGLEWQCVELINRLYITKGWITKHWAGNGNALYGKNATSVGLTNQQPQGSITYLAPGDVISFDSTLSSAGHAAVVSAVSGSAITLVNQNTASTSTISFGTLSDGKFTLNTWKGFTAIGVVHAPVPQTLPAQPTNPRVTSTSETSAVLSWTDASKNATSFASQYRIGSGSWVAGPSVGAGATSMTVTGLKASTSYTFQVGARNSVGTHWSAYFTGKTTAQPAPPPAPAAYHTGREVTIDTHATGGVSGHKGPGNSYAAGPTHAANSPLWIVCYVTGQSITGPYDTTKIGRVS